MEVWGILSGGNMLHAIWPNGRVPLIPKYEGFAPLTNEGCPEHVYRVQLSRTTFVQRDLMALVMASMGLGTKAEALEFLNSGAQWLPLRAGNFSHVGLAVVPAGNGTG